MFDSKKLASAMDKLKNGDKNAFNYIYEATSRLVFYIIYPIVKDYAKAEDVMQNVYINVFEKIALYQKNSSPKAWIATIARNLAINEHKSNKNMINLDVERFSDTLVADKPINTPLIDLAQEYLSQDEFLIVMLVVCEGYKRREVAEILNLSTSGVTWKLNEALNKLKTLTKGGVE